MDKITERIYDYVKNNRMITGGDRIIVGVSGGADSVALLMLLLELKPLIGFSVYAVHVEHGIRGEDSLKDAEYVKALCENLNVTLTTYNIKAVDYAKENKLTVEEAARIMRYDCFRKTMKEIKANKIAVAHHMDDQAETVLFNMVRGSGIKGLSGIRPVNADVIRPILCLRKTELIEYLDNKGMSYCVDVTNEDTDYSRNRIRNNIIPELNEITPAAVEHIAREASELAEIDDCIEGIGKALYKQCVTKRTRNKRTEYAVDIDKIKNSHIVLKRHVIKTIIWELEKRWKDIGFINVEDALSLITKQSGRRVDLPRGLKCIRIADELIFYKETDDDVSNVVTNAEESNTGAEIAETQLTDGMVIDINDAKMEVRVFERPDNAEFPTDTYTKWFDYDKIKNGVCLRNRRPGDYIVIDDNGNTQSYKKFCIGAKIPLDIRYSVPLIALDKEILWVVGYRMGSSNRITDDTKMIMEVKFTGGIYNE